MARLSVVVFFTALMLRLLHLLALQGSEFIDVPGLDGRRYLEMAQGLRTGDWPGRSPFFRPPLYPYFVGLLQSIFGDSMMPVRLAQAVIGAGTCVLALWLGVKSFADRRVGIYGAWVCVFYGPLISFETQILPATLDVFLQTAALLALLVGGERASRLSWFTAGLLAGCAAVHRGEAILLTGIAVLWLLKVSPAVLCDVGRAKARALALAVFLLPIIILIGSVALHNARYDEAPSGRGSAETRSIAATDFGATLGRLLRGQFVLIAGNGGINFYLGNHSEVGERNDVNHPEHFEAYTRGVYLPIDRGLSSTAKRSTYLVQTTLQDMSSQPLLAATRITQKLLRAVNGAELSRNSNLYAARSDSWVMRILFWHWLASFPAGLMIPLALWGVFVTSPRPNAALLLNARLVLWLLFVLVFFVTARYRAPIVPILALYAVAGVFELRRRLGGTDQRVKRRTAISLFALVFIAQLPVVPVHAERGTYELLQLGLSFNGAGDFGAAERSFRRALERDPENVSALTRLGVLMRRRGQLEEARSLLDRAASRGTRDPTTYIALGLTCLSMRDYISAEKWLRVAATLNGRLATVHNNLGLALVLQGKTDEALTAYREALRVDPSHADAHYNIASVLESRGDIDGARRRYEAAVRAQPGHLRARAKLDGL